jgi:hypothetical protein
MSEGIDKCVASAHQLELLFWDPLQKKWGHLQIVEVKLS